MEIFYLTSTLIRGHYNMYNYLLIDQNSLFSVQLFTNTHIMSGVKFLQCHFLGKKYISTYVFASMPIPTFCCVNQANLGEVNNLGTTAEFSVHKKISPDL